jgi:hypothetical protein
VQNEICSRGAVPRIEEWKIQRHYPKRNADIRVFHLQGPEIQTMYSLNMPVSAIRTKIRQEFERHRYVNQLKTTDVLLFNSHQEFQVSLKKYSQVLFCKNEY